MNDQIYDKRFSFIAEDPVLAEDLEAKFKESGMSSMNEFLNDIIFNYLYNHNCHFELRDMADCISGLSYQIEKLNEKLNTKKD